MTDSTPAPRRTGTSIHRDAAMNLVSEAHNSGHAARPAKPGIQVTVSYDPQDGEYLVAAVSSPGHLLRPLYAYRPTKSDPAAGSDQAIERVVEILTAFSD